MSNSESGKSSIMKYIPEERIQLREYLTKIGIKSIEKHIILVNGVKASLDSIAEKNDEIIVLPILKGG